MSDERIIETFGRFRLVKQDPQGEYRIICAETGQSSVTLHWTDVERIKDDPALMADWNLDQ